MPKNIVICSDGTGNADIKGRGTNVFKLFEAIDLNGHRTNPDLCPQVALYDDGVGTEDFKPVKIFAGVTGYGLSRNVKQLYKELVRIYDPGDNLYLFGFSRGAFTARTLAGFIAKCGIVDVAKFATTDALEAAINKAYKIYRRSYRTELAKLFQKEPDPGIIKEFRSHYCIDLDVPIAFLGVWDTVDAVGLPFHVSDFINLVFYRFKFPDYRLSKAVKHACHALAIDDERHSFHPLLWQEDKSDRGRIEQVWFAGAHSNVGGGYTKHGMSLVTLDWMMRKAEGIGLRLLASDRKLYCEHANVDDKLYDPRAGLGVFYRWKPRDIAALCQKNNVPPVIHLSVLERVAHGTEDYGPGNLPPNGRVIITSMGDRDKDVAAGERATAVEKILHAAHTDGQPLLHHVRPAVVVGHISYYVYLASCIAVLIAASSSEGGASLVHPWLVLKNAALLIFDIITLQVVALFNTFKRLLVSPGLVGLLLGGFVLSYFLQLIADQRMNRVFSQFWHQVQPALRSALKGARNSAAQIQERVKQFG